MNITKYDCKTKTKLIIGAFAASLICAGCGILSNPVNYSAPAIMEYSISGGVVGVNEKTIINENGFGELAHYAYGQKFVIQYQLSESQLDSLKRTFDDADFFYLKNEYKPSQTVADGFSYTITYATGDRTKTVLAEDGANYPKKLRNLLGKLHETNLLIKSIPDAGTLVIDREYKIKQWLFSEDIKLEDNLQKEVYYLDSKVFREIFSFFVRIHNEEPRSSFLFWENDHLYQISASGLALYFEENIGNYFYPFRRHPVRFWPPEFGFQLSEIPEAGLILESEEFNRVNNLLKEDATYFNIFIFDELKDGGKAVSLYLVSGKPRVIQK